MAVITPANRAALVAAFAKYGHDLLDAKKAELESFLHKISDGDANQIISAIAQHVDLHGLASVAQNPIRNALTGAEPAIDNVINANLDAAIEGADKWLLSFSGGIAR